MKMKILIILLSLVSIDHSCSQAIKNQDSIIIEYSAQSRGTYKHIVITKKLISITNIRGENPITKTCNTTTWDSILKAFEPIDIENIPNLKAPSENRFFDGAAIGNFKINYNGKTYESPSFDHGNPPKEIAALVKEILSISENIE